MLHIGALLLALTFAACATVGGSPAQTASNEPRSLIVGRIKVQDGYRDITSSCKATFTDVYGNVKKELPLDASGYVFTGALPGKTYLERVRCPQHDVSYETRELAFEVAEPPLATYFGHVHFSRTEAAVRAEERARTGRAVGLLIGGFVGAFVMAATMPGASSGSPTTITVAERPNDLLDNYRRRHGGHELPVPMAYSLPNLDLNRPTVMLNGEQLAVDANLEGGVTLAWFGNTDPTGGRLTLRIAQPSRGASLEGCPTLDVTCDTTTLHLPIKHQTDTSKKPAHESVDAELDAPAMQCILDANIVSLKACALARRLSFQAALAGRLLFRAYQARMDEHAKEGRLVPVLAAERAQPAATMSEAP